MEEKKVEIILTRGYDKKTVSLEEAIGYICDPEGWCAEPAAFMIDAHGHWVYLLSNYDTQLAYAAASLGMAKRRCLVEDARELAGEYAKWI